MQKNTTNLKVWADAIDLAVIVFDEVTRFPEKGSSLAQQMIRSAISVPSNIAEGKGRLSDRESRQFMGIARGSLLELQSQVIIAGRVNLLDPGVVKLTLDRINEVGRELNGLIRFYSNAIEQESRKR